MSPPNESLEEGVDEIIEGWPSPEELNLEASLENQPENQGFGSFVSGILPGAEEAISDVISAIRNAPSVKEVITKMPSTIAEELGKPYGALRVLPPVQIAEHILTRPRESYLLASEIGLPLVAGAATAEFGAGVPAFIATQEAADVFNRAIGIKEGAPFTKAHGKAVGERGLFNLGFLGLGKASQVLGGQKAKLAQAKTEPETISTRLIKGSTKQAQVLRAELEEGDAFLRNSGFWRGGTGYDHKLGKFKIFPRKPPSATQLIKNADEAATLATQQIDQGLESIDKAAKAYNANVGTKVLAGEEAEKIAGIKFADIEEKIGKTLSEIERQSTSFLTAEEAATKREIINKLRRDVDTTIGELGFSGEPPAAQWSVAMAQVEEELKQAITRLVPKTQPEVLKELEKNLLDLQKSRSKFIERHGREAQDILSLKKDIAEELLVKSQRIRNKFEKFRTEGVPKTKAGQAGLFNQALQTYDNIIQGINEAAHARGPDILRLEKRITEIDNQITNTQAMIKASQGMVPEPDLQAIRLLKAERDSLSAGARLQHKRNLRQIGELSLRQTHNLIRNIDDALEALKYYDAQFQGQLINNPSLATQVVQQARRSRAISGPLMQLRTAIKETRNAKIEEIFNRIGKDNIFLKDWSPQSIDNLSELVHNSINIRKALEGYKSDLGADIQAAVKEGKINPISPSPQGGFYSLLRGGIHKAISPFGYYDPDIARQSLTQEGINKINQAINLSQGKYGVRGRIGETGALLKTPWGLAGGPAAINALNRVGPEGSDQIYQHVSRYGIDPQPETIDLNFDFFSRDINKLASSANFREQLEEKFVINAMLRSGELQVDTESVPLEKYNSYLPEASEKANAIVSQLAKLQQQYGEDADQVGAYLATITKQYPEFFKPSTTGIPGEIKWKGNIRLFQEEDIKQYANKINADKNLSPIDKGRITSALYDPYAPGTVVD